VTGANELDGCAANGSASEGDRRNGDSISALTAVVVVSGREGEIV
jgi:hypothetical protein